jgi:hypothetical protein
MSNPINEREALALCAATFRRYETMHLAKPDQAKADVNARMAEMCERVLSQQKPVLDVPAMPVPQTDGWSVPGLVPPVPGAR